MYEWHATVHKVEGTKLYLEYAERAGEYTEIPRPNIEYCRISCRCDPLISGTPIAEAQNVKRPRDDDNYQGGEQSMPFTPIGTAVGGFTIPSNAGHFAIFYPSIWLSKLMAGSPGAMVVSEWKNDVVEWMRTRELDPRSTAAKSELDACREHVSDFFKVAEVLLAEKKYSIELIPDSMWRMGHHLMESLLKVVFYAKKGPEGVATLRMKLDSMWAKSKIDYATLYEQVISFKTTNTQVYQAPQDRSYFPPNNPKGNFRSKN